MYICVEKWRVEKWRVEKWRVEKWHIPAGSSLRSDMGFSLPEGVNKTQLRTLGGVRPKDSRP